MKSGAGGEGTPRSGGAATVPSSPRADCTPPQRPFYRRQLRRRLGHCHHRRQPGFRFLLLLLLLLGDGGTLRHATRGHPRHRLRAGPRWRKNLLRCRLLGPRRGPRGGLSGPACDAADARLAAADLSRDDRDRSVKRVHVKADAVHHAPRGRLVVAEDALELLKRKAPTGVQDPMLPGPLGRSLLPLPDGPLAGTNAPLLVHSPTSARRSLYPYHPSTPTARSGPTTTYAPLRRG